METLAQQFITKEQQQRVSEAVHLAEKTTSGEIIPMIVSTSHSYPIATLYGALFISLASALLLTTPIAQLLKLPAHNMWIFLCLYGILFPVFFRLIKKNAYLQSLFLFTADVEEAVREAAIKAFYSEQLYKTKEENGILIYISVFEKKAWILGDHGINDKIDQRKWDEIIAALTQGIKKGNCCESLCDTVTKVGVILEKFFPIKENDSNELHDLIVK